MVYKIEIETQKSSPWKKHNGVFVSSSDRNGDQIADVQYYVDGIDFEVLHVCSYSFVQEDFKTRQAMVAHVKRFVRAWCAANERFLEWVCAYKGETTDEIRAFGQPVVNFVVDGCSPCCVRDEWNKGNRSDGTQFEIDDHGFVVAGDLIDDDCDGPSGSDALQLMTIPGPEGIKIAPRKDPALPSVWVQHGPAYRVPTESGFRYQKDSFLFAEASDPSTLFVFSHKWSSDSVSSAKEWRTRVEKIGALNPLHWDKMGVSCDL